MRYKEKYIKRHNYKNFNITRCELEEKGIFFRLPIRKQYFTTWDILTDSPSIWDYLDHIKNPIWCFYQILIGNYQIIKNGKEWSKDDNFAGFLANVICSPIYFKRRSRCIEVYPNSDDTRIAKIVSYGYEDEFINVSGECIKETTTITFKNSKKIKMINKGDYNCTYLSEIEKLINLYEGD